MKRSFLLIFCFVFINFYSQKKVSYVKDTAQKLSIKNISETPFFPVDDLLVLEKKSDAVYWFKTSTFATDAVYVFQIQNIEIKNIEAYQNGKQLSKMPHERYPAFKIDPNFEAYFRVTSDSKANFPISFDSLEDFVYKEKNELVINGFYYGFAFVVVLYSLFYYFFFRDTTYLYYAIFLLNITFAFFLLDGMFDLFGFSTETVKIIIVANYVSLAYFSSKFINSFLNLEEIYPKLKTYTYAVGFVIIALAFSYIFIGNYNFYVALSMLVFLLMTTYWITGILLFKKNVFTKILVFGYALLLFGSLDSFVFTNFGISFLNLNTHHLKIAGIIQIIALWFAVVFREKSLKKENRAMKIDIINYTKKLQEIGNNFNKEKLVNNLTVREREIFDLIIAGNTNKQIADSISVSINTVKFHIKNI